MALVSHSRIGDSVAVDLDVVIGAITGVSASNTSARDYIVTLVSPLDLAQTVTVSAGTVTPQLTTLGTSLTGAAAGLRVGVRAA